MLSKSESRRKIGENSGHGKLLNDIESLSKALHLDRTTPRSLMSTVSSRSKAVGKSNSAETKSKAVRKDLAEKENKKSGWGWKGLKALTHVPNRRFNCCFTLQVHCVEGLPPLFDDLSLIVHWRRRDAELSTKSVTVVEGVAEFEQELKHSCSVYGSGNGPYHSAKYEAKHFLLYVSIYGVPKLDLGKHRVDLTRLLPLALEELEGEKSSGKWTTTYRLSGRAKGASLNVSFGYAVLQDNPSKKNVIEGQNRGSAVRRLGQYEQAIVRHAGSLPSKSSVSKRSLAARFAAESSLSLKSIKDVHEASPVSRLEFSESVNVLYQKLEEEMLGVPTGPNMSDNVESSKPDSKLPSEVGMGNAADECEVVEFSVIEKGIELSSKEQEKTGVDSIGNSHDSVEGCIVPANAFGRPPDSELQLQSMTKEIGGNKEDDQVNDFDFKEKDDSTKESIMKELDSMLDVVSNLANEGLDYPDDEREVINEDSCFGTKGNYTKVRKGNSLGPDDAYGDGDFLDMLGIEHSPFGLSSESEPDSPRERLLRQFEKDALVNGHSLFNFDMDTDPCLSVCDALNDPDCSNSSKDFDYTSVTESSKMIPGIKIENTRNKTTASMLEDLETEVLMHELGLNERAFQYSPSSSTFGSPIDLPPEDLDHLPPPLGEGLGSFVQTKNGGFLRSMNPALFKNAKSGGKLILQVSSPVVVPAEMGSGVMDILQHLASIGIEKFSMQANKLMPLEDITGKTMQQIAWEAAPSLEGPERHGKLSREFEVVENMSGFPDMLQGKSRGLKPSKLESSSTGTRCDSEYVSLEDLAPLAMDKIESLSIEGLRIQAGLSDEDTPSNISPQSVGESSASEGKTVIFGGSKGLEGTGGLQLMNIKDNGDEVDGLMGLCLSLDEWMKLDSGEIDYEDGISERTCKLLSAHHAKRADLSKGRSRCGLLSNNFTVALMVQLHDPLRNFEPVGAPMLTLVQVERVFVPPKPKMYSSVCEVRCNSEEDEESEAAKKDEIMEEPKVERIPEEELISQYKITEVHVAGLKTEQGRKKLWGSKTQQQTGSRWLLANGMGKKNKHPLMKSKASNKSSLPASTTPDTTTVQPGDTLWSISSRIHGTGAKWKELAALNPHIRNPNVIFPNETVKLR
ncbi:protein PLASTID MOVEMENT IMPAIRED 1-RELATED 1-like [Ipomoea triloba]|uniref:protein PLASTID MOVEMENT IMPAIRED 1-RELATED 1-like n=1 Tax=Ipomoea triloba TaxID=35885 RepID=UPI00125D353F|nr:protein PLASTID MOVEMENT IMPAIRED 1-RELATED 1-like [Ipomoea triloba]XP_031108860.1 protein PLASTID MOVEMENT IMPAIRED 1-RELATED 1-like [Ipomoea triloba]XP_031108861.1 protein PLASTID MOVEMENT IMPAIRED 1-RELATED 1-like [Ipomoea triloba]